MTITEVLNQLYDEIDESGIVLSDYGIYDEEDLKVFALQYLMSNLDDAFEELVDDEELVAL